MKIRLTEEIWKEGNMYVSYCPELDIASCGKDVQQAKKNLMEAIIINIEETRKMGTFEQFLEDYGLEEVDGNILSARKELVGFTAIEVPVCPVQFFAEDERSLSRRSGRSYWGEFNWGDSKKQKAKRAISTPSRFSPLTNEAI